MTPMLRRKILQASVLTSIILVICVSFFAYDHTTQKSGIVRGIFDEQTAHNIALSQALPLAFADEPVRTADTSDLVLVDAHASVTLDASTGEILYEHKAREHRQVASLTKIATAMMVVDRVADLNEPLTISENAYATVGSKVGCTNASLCPSNRLAVGEHITVRDGLRALLMNSANDAATALAEHVSGSEEQFIQELNVHVATMGLVDTHFCRASGLEIDGREEECYSSAYDIAQIMAHMVTHPQYDQLWEMARATEAVIYSTDGTIEHKLINTNQLLGEFNGLIGAKTGFTPQAGYAVALAAQEPNTGHRIVGVILDNPHRWRDIAQMVRWTFASYQWE